MNSGPESTPLLPVTASSSNSLEKTARDGYTWAGEVEGEDAPEKRGTIFSSAMNLAACALGASMLSLPYAMMLSGPIVALCCLVLFAIMAFFAAQAVVNAGIQCKKSTYTEIVTYYFGNFQGTVADILLALALGVAAISYMVGLADLLPDMIPATENLSKSSRIIGVLLPLYYVTLTSNLSVFGPASAIATAGCYIQAGALLLQLVTSHGGKTGWTVPPSSTLFSFNIGGLLYSLPMVCFVYAFHYVLTDTLAEVENPTERRLALVNFSSVGILIGCYLPVAISGYLSMSGVNIQDNVLKGLPAGSPVVGIARWSIGLLLFITYSLFIIPLRRKLEDVIFGEQTVDKFDPRRLGVAAGLMFAIGSVSIALPSLGLANSIAGGCIAIVMFYFPGALLWRMQMDLPLEQRDRTQLIFGGFFMGVGVLVCLMGLFGDMIFDF